MSWLFDRAIKSASTNKESVRDTESLSASGPTEWNRPQTCLHDTSISPFTFKNKFKNSPV